LAASTGGSSPLQLSICAVASDARPAKTTSAAAATRATLAIVADNGCGH